MAKPLGPLETQFFAYAQMRRINSVRIGDLMAPLRLSEVQERKLLSQLARKGLIVRVIRGLYLVPPRLPLGGAWSPDQALAINSLMEDATTTNGSPSGRRGPRKEAPRYQICGPNAFNRYGFDQQVPARVYLYNNRFSGVRQIGAVALSLIKVAEDRLGSAEEATTREGLKLIYASRARTLVDAVYDWARFDSLPRGYEWIRRELAAQRVSDDELVHDTLRYGNQGTIRRMGYLLEQEKTPVQLLRRLQKALTPSSSVIPWVPNAPKRGKTNVRWGIVDEPNGRGL